MNRAAHTLAVIVATLVVCGSGAAVAAPAKHPPKARKTPIAAEPLEPPVLQKIIAARWRLASARAALPPVQLIYDEAFEFQDFIEYAFDGGALRLCVSPDPQGGEIFALLVDTRAQHYEAFARLAPSGQYTTYHRHPYVVVLPLRPVSRNTFESLKAKQWTAEELQQQLGAPSFHWRVHGAGFLGLTYVPQGLSFIGDPITPVTYQIHAAEIEDQWRERHLLDRSLPPLLSLRPLKYPELQTQNRMEFATELLNQRARIDQALAHGKRSSDDRFVVGHANLAGGIATAEEVVIREGNKPERRYRAPHFIHDKGYLWLNPRTVVFQVHAADLEFYTIDAPSGIMTLVTKVPADRLRPVTEFGVSGAQRFWYRTDDGTINEVTVESPKSPKTPKSSKPPKTPKSPKRSGTK